jgi:hypothetical protein
LRFAGRGTGEHEIQLLESDIEELIFPTQIKTLMNSLGTTLREHYEEAIDHMFELELLDGDSLADIYGGEEVPECVWENNIEEDHALDAVAEEDPGSSAPSWYIPLTDCQRIATFPQA